MLKKIALLGASIDALGRFADAGTELDVIADDATPVAGAVHAGKARELVDQQRAVSKAQAEGLEKQAEQPADPVPPGKRGG